MSRSLLLILGVTIILIILMRGTKREEFKEGLEMWRKCANEGENCNTEKCRYVQMGTTATWEGGIGGGALTNGFNGNAFPAPRLAPKKGDVFGTPGTRTNIDYVGMPHTYPGYVPCVIKGPIGREGPFPEAGVIAQDLEIVAPASQKHDMECRCCPEEHLILGTAYGLGPGFFYCGVLDAPCSCAKDWGECKLPNGATCGKGTQTRTCIQATGAGTPCSSMPNGTGDSSQSCTVGCNCPYSAFSVPVVPGKTGSPCLKAGGTLNSGGSCSLACAPGYNSSTSTYNCSKEGTLSGGPPTCTKKKCPVPSLNPFVIPDSTKTTPCEVGKVLETGETCYVTCEQGYEAASGGGIYSCSSNGTYTPGNLKCKKKLCPPIPTFDTNTMVGGPDPPCTPSEQLAPGKKCNISCKAAYNSTGSGTYTCGPDATFTTKSTLQCSTKTCVIPSFGDGIIAGPTPSCKVGEKLAEGANCNVMCKTGYTHTGSGVYSCSEDGQLTEASLSCTPPNPTCALDFKCPLNQHLTNPLPTTPCASSTCVAGDCCAANPQCSTLKNCNAGRRFKQNYQNIICAGANCEDADCCEAIPQPTCQGYPCLYALFYYG